jgi:Poly(ADP-ribose) polymerase catalytic domain.
MQIFDVPVNTQECRRFEKLLNDTRATTAHTFEIKSMKRIQNMHLWQKYMLEKTELQDRKGCDIKDMVMPCVDPDVNEYYLWHGTCRVSQIKLIRHVRRVAVVRSVLP